MNPNEREYNDWDMPQIEEMQMDDEPIDMTDVEADADTLASAGWGMYEDYDPSCSGLDDW